MIIEVLKPVLNERITMW